MICTASPPSVHALCVAWKAVHFMFVPELLRIFVQVSTNAMVPEAESTATLLPFPNACLCNTVSIVDLCNSAVRQCHSPSSLIISLGLIYALTSACCVAKRVQDSCCSQATPYHLAQQGGASRSSAVVQHVEHICVPPVSTRSDREIKEQCNRLWCAEVPWLFGVGFVL